MLTLGIDAGRDVLAIALLETGGRTPRLVGSWDEPRDAARPLEEQLRELIERRAPQHDAAATALPGTAVSHRILRLPFSDAARLSATVPFELEDLVPFDVEGAVVAFSVLERDASGATVLAAITQRASVERHLETMAAAGVDPAVVDLGTLAVANLLRSRSDDLLLVEPREDGGLAVLRGGKLAALRVFDAQPGPDGLQELRWAALALLEDERGVPPVAVVGAADQGRDVAAALGATPLALSSELAPWCAGAPARHLRAIGLAARAGGIAPLGLDFRTGEFAYHAPSEEAQRQLRIAGWLAAAVVVLALASFVAAVTARRAELAQHRAEVARAVADVLPGAAPGTERTRLQGAIDTLQARREVLGGAAADRPKTLDLLRAVSEAVPEQVPVTIDDFAIDDDGFRLHARTDSYESVDVVKRALQSVPGLYNPEVKDVKAGVDGRIEFRIALRFAPEART